MQFSKQSLIIIIQLFFSTIFAAPTDKVGRQALKNILKSIRNQISESSKWKFANCHENPEFPDEIKPLEKIENLLKKLKNPNENFEKTDMDNVLDMIDEYSIQLEQIMEKIVKSLQTYKDWNFYEAVHVEKEKIRPNSDKNALKFETPIELERANHYSNRNLLENIRNHFEKVSILQKLTKPETQNEYADYFFMYFYTKEDLNRELKNAEEHLRKIPQECEVTCEMWKCHGSLLDEENLGCALCCAPCFLAACLTTEAVICATCVPVEMACCIRRSCARCKIEKIKAKLAKIEEQEEKFVTGKEKK